MDSLLTWQQVADAAGVPESTARYWRRQHRAYFPSVKSGRYERYKPACIDVLRAIAPLADANLPPEEIEAALRAEFVPVYDAPQPPGAAAAQPPLAMLSQVVADAVERAQSEQIALLRDEVARLKGEIVARDELAAARDEELRALLAERLPASNTGAWERLKRRLGMI